MSRTCLNQCKDVIDIHGKVSYLCISSIFKLNETEPWRLAGNPYVDLFRCKRHAAQQQRNKKRRRKCRSKEVVNVHRKGETLTNFSKLCESTLEILFLDRHTNFITGHEQIHLAVYMETQTKEEGEKRLGEKRFEVHRV
jgi:hypothetical protein